MEHLDFCLHLDAASPLEKYPAKQHARRVADFLGVEKGLIYLPGAPTAYLEDSDQFVPFRQRRYFYYLTGVDEADCHLTYDIRLDFLTLYVPSPGSPRKVYYNGRGSTPEEALAKYDVDAVDFSYAVPGYVEFWMTQHEGDVYILHPDQAVVPGHDKSPRVNYTKLQVAIDAARVRKDQHEIKLIRKANQISAKAHEKVLRNIRAFKNEAQVEATFLDTCVAADAKHQAYEIIAASGENAATLHYIKNDEPFHDRPLMCLDAGCEWQCYASDVTRTFPLSGQWPSKESKEIYDLVLSIQTECIDAIRPGARYLDIHYLAHRILIHGLLELGILHNGTPEDIFDAGTSLAFLPHGLGHHLGLEVHDVSDVPLMAGSAQYMSSVVDPEMCKALVHPNHPALEEGMVVTVEPGIYFNRYALNAVYLSSPIHSKYINRRVLQRYLPVGGVRIEDDILVTDDGYENLTTAPKGEEMLRIMQEGCDGPLRSEPRRKHPQHSSTAKVQKKVHRASTTKSKGIEAWSQDVTAGPPETFQRRPESTTASSVVELEGSQAGPQTPKRSVPANLAAAPASFGACDWPIHEGAVAAELPSEPERNSEPQVQGEWQASHWRKVPSALARIASTQSLPNHSLPEYSPSQMFQRPRQAPMPPQKLPELPVKPLAYRQSMPIVISGSQAAKPSPNGPLCAPASARPRPGPSRSASERLPDRTRFRLSESNLPATVAEVGHDSPRIEPDRHLTHRASIAIGEKYPQPAYQQENQLNAMREQTVQPQQLHFSVSQEQDIGQQMAQAYHMYQTGQIAQADLSFQLMLIERENKRRFALAQQEQQAMCVSDKEAFNPVQVAQMEQNQMQHERQQISAADNASNNKANEDVPSPDQRQRSQDYQLHLMLLEQQNKKRLLMARRQHEAARASNNEALNPVSKDQPQQPQFTASEEHIQGRRQEWAERKSRGRVQQDYSMFLMMLEMNNKKPGSIDRFLDSLDPENYAKMLFLLEKTNMSHLARASHNKPLIPAFKDQAAEQDYETKLDELRQGVKQRSETAMQKHKARLARENGALNPDLKPAQPSSSPSPSSYHTAGFDMKY